MHRDPDCESLYKQLDLVESQIYELEQEYLEETSTFNNKPNNQTNSIKSKAYKQSKYPISFNSQIKAKDRLFSLSSCTSGANIELKKEVEQMPCELMSKNAKSVFKRKIGDKIEGLGKKIKRGGKAKDNSNGFIEDKDEKTSKSILSEKSGRTILNDVSGRKKGFKVNKRISKGNKNKEKKD